MYWTWFENDMIHFYTSLRSVVALKNKLLCFYKFLHYWWKTKPHDGSRINCYWDRDIDYVGYNDIRRRGRRLRWDLWSMSFTSSFHNYPPMRGRCPFVGSETVVVSTGEWVFVCPGLGWCNSGVVWSERGGVLWSYEKGELLGWWTGDCSSVQCFTKTNTCL